MHIFYIHVLHMHGLQVLYLQSKKGGVFMKKKFVATIMSLTLGAAMLTACGSSVEEETVDTVIEETTEVESTEVEAVEDTTEVGTEAETEAVEDTAEAETEAVEDTAEAGTEAETEAAAN